nr:efflux RND transporter permease subunit [Cupriavidus necator]
MTGVEGKMFHPMALTAVLARVGAIILSVVFLPAAIAMFLTGSIRAEPTPRSSVSMRDSSIALG